MVALPAFSCIDLTAAVQFTGVDVVLYDLDPATLSPDTDSLARALSGGVDAVVAAHLYGHPVDMRSVIRLAADHGVPVIEDAAQAAGGCLDGRPLGAYGALTVLSFGRGKGTTGGAGGALLAVDPVFRAALAKSALRPGIIGMGSLLATGIQWMLGRPSLYAIPSVTPGLHLGEMVYHPAREPRGMARSAVALVNAGEADASAELATRTRNAERLTSIASSVDDLRVIRPVAGAAPGYLRLPVLDLGGRSPNASLGVLRGYPRAMHEQAELGPRLRHPSRMFPGALELRRSLFTLPTHSLVRERDIERISQWLGPHARGVHAERREPRAASAI